MTKRTVLVICCGTVLAMLCASGTASAQVLYGTLTGNVTDSSGAVIPGAKVEALNVGTGTARQTTTNRGTGTGGERQVWFAARVTF